MVILKSCKLLDVPSREDATSGLGEEGGGLEGWRGNGAHMVTGDGEGMVMAGGGGMVTDRQLVQTTDRHNGIHLKAQTQREGGAKVEGRLTSTGR